MFRWIHCGLLRWGLQNIHVEMQRIDQTHCPRQEYIVSALRVTFRSAMFKTLPLQEQATVLLSSFCSESLSRVNFVNCFPITLRLMNFTDVRIQREKVCLHKQKFHTRPNCPRRQNAQSCQLTEWSTAPGRAFGITLSHSEH